MIWNVGTLVTVTSKVPHDLIAGTRIQFQNIIQSSAGNMIALNGQTYTITSILDPYTFTFISTFTITNVGAFTSGNIGFPDAVPQYFHLLRGEAQFTQLTNFTVVHSNSATPVKIRLDKRSYFRDKDQVVLTGGGTYFLKYANEFEYFLYSDEKLQSPVSGVANQFVGTISEVFKNTLRFKRSDEKGSIYGKPTVQSPFYQQSYNLIKILPENEACNWIKLDFIRVPPMMIDVNDTTNDLTNFYPLQFQYAIENKALKIFFESSKDMIGISTASNDVIRNP